MESAYNRQNNNMLLTWHISRQKKKNMFPARRFYTSQLLKVYWRKNWKSASTDYLLIEVELLWNLDVEVIPVRL